MFYKNVICLLVGLIVGIRLTDFWDYGKLQSGSSKEQQGNGVTEAQALADQLYNTTRVLCWVMTTPENHRKRAIHVKNTWGRRCNKLLFMSTQQDAELETVALPVQEGRSHLWQKTRAAFKYVHDRHYDEADWFLKADDDTYVIMENLREFLYQFSADEPVYFGCKFGRFVKQGYMSGGAGYVLSKKALSLFAKAIEHNPSVCSTSTLSEDKEMGICLENIGVVAGDSRDELGEERFLPLAPMHLIPVDTSNWYGVYLFYHRDGKQAISRKAISFHYIKPKDFYIMEYFFYHLRIFGVEKTIVRLPEKANMTALMQKWRNETSAPERW